MTLRPLAVDQTHSKSTFQEWVDLPDGDGTEGRELAKTELHEVERETHQRQHRAVGDQKRAWRNERLKYYLCL